MSKLREQVAKAVQAKRSREGKTRTNQKYLKMFRKQLENFLEQKKRINLEPPLLGLQSTQKRVTKKGQFLSTNWLLKS